MADILIHAVSKHDALAPSHSNEDRHRQYRDRLALAAPQLTAREVEGLRGHCPRSQLCGDCKLNGPEH